MTSLTLPTLETPDHHTSYSLDIFLEKLRLENEAIIQSTPPDPHTTRFLCRAPLKSFELCKHQSWMEWRHEFVILTVTHESQDYLIHINRAWAAPEGWRQYIPPITWGSQKPSHDEVVIYVPGKWETAARYGTHVIARFDLPGLDLWLGIKPLWEPRAEYSLIGMNCWALSRHFVLNLVRLNAFRGISGSITGRPGLASAEELLLFLRNAGPWALIPYVDAEYDKRPTYLRLFHRIDVLLEALFHGFNTYRQMRGSRGSQRVFSPAPEGFKRFHRVKKVLVTSEGGFYRDANTSHSFGPLGFAYDVPENTHSDSLSRADDVLYLLTPPILPPGGQRVVKMSVGVVNPDKLNYKGDLIESLPPQSDSWMTYGLVRQDDRSGKLYIARRWRLEGGGGSWIWSGRHLAELFRPGDMIGLWACGPPGPVALCKWVMAVDEAFAVIQFGKVFEESRLLPCDIGQQDWSADSLRKATGSAQGVLAPRFAPRLEFGRFAALAIACDKTLNVGREGEDCTLTGLPHSFDSCGLAVDLDAPLYSNTHCKPGDFLYLLTPPIRTAPQKRVLSVTVYTWSIQRSLGGDGAGPQVSFEVGGVQPTGDGGLELSGPRHEISRNFHSIAKNTHYKRHRRRMDDNHPFVRGLKDGDMIGLWVVVRDPFTACGVQKSLMVVEIGPEVGLVGRYIRFAYDEIQDVIDRSEFEVPSWTHVVGTVVLTGALFAGFSRLWKGR